MTRPGTGRQQSAAAAETERRERAERIAEGAERVARIAVDLAAIVHQNADTIAGWPVWSLHRRRH